MSKYERIVQYLKGNGYEVTRDAEAHSRYFYSVLEVPGKPWLPKFYINKRGEVWHGFKLVEAFRVPDSETDTWE